MEDLKKEESKVDADNEIKVKKEESKVKIKQADADNEIKVKKKESKVKIKQADADNEIKAEKKKGISSFFSSIVSKIKQKKATPVGCGKNIVWSQLQSLSEEKILELYQVKTLDEAKKIIENQRFTEVRTKYEKEAIIIPDNMSENYKK